MEILNTYTSNSLNAVGIITVIGLFIAMICLLIAAVNLSDAQHKILPNICLIAVLLILCLELFIVNETIPLFCDQISHYEIVVDDEYPASQLLKNYEITEVNGRILDCVLKEVD